MRHATSNKGYLTVTRDTRHAARQRQRQDMGRHRISRHVYSSIRSPLSLVACCLLFVGPAGAAEDATLPLPASPSGVLVDRPQSEEPAAGYIFGANVTAGNYYFAKRVAYTFPRPGQEALEPADRERAVWESLILHYEAFRRGVTAPEAQLGERINAVLRAQQQSFTRSDREAYARWVKETLGEDVELFENQMRFLLEIDLLKDAMRLSFPVSITERELREEYLNEHHHVGGDMAVFETKDEAQAFYEQVREPGRWDAVKAQGGVPIKPVALMTLEAYIDLWKIPKARIDAFHALDIGAVGEPMPFGSQWCVYRLLEKRTGDLAEFPAARAQYVAQLTQRKQFEALNRWIHELKTSAHLRIQPLNRQ